MVLDDGLNKYVTVNTHRGLYQYNRLPFGIASASTLFQQLLNSLLEGTPHVIFYIDDILVTCSSDEDHIRNLSIDFERLEEHGFHLKKKKAHTYNT